MKDQNVCISKDAPDANGFIIPTEIILELDASANHQQKIDQNVSLLYIQIKISDLIG